MAQNMAVSVTLRLQDQFTGPVRALMQQLQGLTRTAQDFNRSIGGAGTSNPFARLTNDARALGNEMRNLVGSVSRLQRALSGSTTGGSFSQRQLADLRQVIALQQQVIANNGRMVAGPPG